MMITRSKKRLDESTQRISRLYYNNYNVEEAVEIMGRQNISAELVNSIYNELSKDAENSMKNRFYYFTVNINYSFDMVDYWTSRYLFAYGFDSSDSAFHEVTLFDVFNNKSM
jgi:hypothetical protein